MAGVLRLAGGITIIIGMIAMLYLFASFSEAGMFSGPGLDIKEIITATGIGFYHFLLGMLCLGVGQLLESSANKKGGITNMDRKENNKATELKKEEITFSYCYYCGADNFEKATVCPKCGKKL